VAKNGVQFSLVILSLNDNTFTFATNFVFNNGFIKRFKIGVHRIQDKFICKFL